MKPELPSGIEPWEMKETPRGKVCLKDGIFYYVYKPGLKIDLEIAKETVKDRFRLCGEVPVFGYAYIRGLQQITPQAMVYLASDEASYCLKAVAIVFKSNFHWAIANFFMKINKPKYITQVFNDPEKARRWLEYCRNSN